jgi:hypothetical protein
LLAVCDCLFSIFAATLHIGGCSCILHLRTHRAMVTGTDLSWHVELYTSEHFYLPICVYIFHIIPSIQALHSAHRKLQKYIYLTVQRNTLSETT